MAYSEINQERIRVLRKTGPKPQPAIERVMDKVVERGPDECWLFEGSGSRSARTPTVSVQGTAYVAYRVVFESAYRLLEDGEWVMHTCDDACCMNPRHLYVGDRAAWARKWHGVDYTVGRYEAGKEKARTKTRAYYQANSEAVRIKSAEYQVKNKIKAVEYLGGKCIRCGFDHPTALQFHHRDPATKLFSITSKELSTPNKRPWNEAIVPELEKCDLLCANCHFLTHAVLSPERVTELRETVLSNA